jgi:endo-alpha-1,4-polygalactosaminidase (GH114 family)
MTALRFKPRQQPRIEVLRASEPGGRPVFRLDYVDQDERSEPFRVTISDHYDAADAIAAGTAWEAQGVAVDYSGALT